MKAKQYTEEQIIAVLKEGEAGAKIADLCRKYGMSDATYYNWKQSHGGHLVALDQTRLHQESRIGLVNVPVRYNPSPLHVTPAPILMVAIPNKPGKHFSLPCSRCG